MSVKIKEFSKLPENLFRLLFINIFFINLFFMTFLGIFSLFGIFPVNFNDEEVFGIKGLLVMIIFTPFTTLTYVSLIWIGLKLGNKIIKVMF